jgi:hypothetical protein
MRRPQTGNCWRKLTASSGASGFAISRRRLPLFRRLANSRKLKAIIGTLEGRSALAVPAQISPWLVVVGALLICASDGLCSVILGPDNYWDLRYYHLYAPWAYLHGRYLYDVGPAQIQGFFNPVADFLFYGLTSSFLNGMPRAIAFIMGAVHGLNAVLIAAIAVHVLRPRERSTRVAARRA